MYYVSFKGRDAKLYKNNRQIVRQFRVAADIVNAQIQGAGDNAVVAITMKNGKTVLYKSNGTVIRP
jgi:hypothetical protein